MSLKRTNYRHNNNNNNNKNHYNNDKYIIIIEIISAEPNKQNIHYYGTMKYGD